MSNGRLQKDSGRHRSSAILLSRGAAVVLTRYMGVWGRRHAVLHAEHCASLDFFGNYDVLIMEDSQYVVSKELVEYMMDTNDASYKCVYMCGQQVGM